MKISILPWLFVKLSFILLGIPFDLKNAFCVSDERFARRGIKSDGRKQNGRNAD